MTRYMTNEQRQLAWRLRARGFSTTAIAREIARSQPAVDYLLAGHKRRGRIDAWTPALGRLSVTEREEILIGIQRGLSFRAIARALGRSASTGSREVAANGGRTNYRIWTAHQRARTCAKRPKDFKLNDPALCAKVTLWLTEFWSPQEIARRLRVEFPDDPTMHVSHETIYQSLFVQGPG